MRITNKKTKERLNNVTTKQRKRGFTLIEIIAALGIFSIVVLAAASIFVMTLQGYRRIVASQNIQENSRYILESMAKEIRAMLWIEEIGSEAPPEDEQEFYPTRLQIFHPTNGKIAYEFAGQNIIRDIMKDNVSHPQVMNSSQVEISGNFVVYRAVNLQTGTPISQLRVVIFMKVRAKGAKPEQQTELNLQTTISQRNFTSREALPY